jgi:uncharacterized paraquat-inducible protein A
MAEHTDLSKQKTIGVSFSLPLSEVQIESITDQISGESVVADYIACPQNIIKFFHSRNSCDCLEKIYTHLRKTPKCTTYCMSCNGVFNVREIKDCSRCKIAQYCSRECQLAHWPNHKEYCKRFCEE